MSDRERIFRESISPDDVLAGKLYACARAAHEVNRAYCIATNDPMLSVAWESVSEGQFASLIDGIKGVLRGNGPVQSHESWLAFKAKEGWKLGPVKDEAKKEHPCFRPYAELPDAQKRKDELFVVTVRAMAAALDLPIL